jgi:predicted dehydrogenase
MTQRKINWGIIGLGNIAHKFAQDLLLVDSAELYAVASRNIEKSQSFALKYHSKKCYGSYEEMIKDPNLDIIYIATPHVFHYENTMHCLKHNKAVLCEKPFAINFSEVKTMIETASHQNLFLMEAMWTRFIPGIQKVIDIVDAGEIGEIECIEANFGFVGNKSLTGRLYNRKLGGGSLMDIGIYPIYLALLLLGEPLKIEAEAVMYNQVDASCNIKFIYQNGKKANLFSTFNENTSTEAIIYGKNGFVKIHKNFHHPKTITISNNSGLERIVNIDYTGNGYYHEIVEVNNCLLKKEIYSLKMPHSKSVELIKILDKVRDLIGISYLNDIKN